MRNKYYDSNNYNLDELDRELEDLIILDDDNMINNEVKSIEKKNLILKNFENKSRSRVIGECFLHKFIIYLVILVIMMIKNLSYKIEPMVILEFSLPFLSVLLLFFIIEVLDSNKKEYKIENEYDRIIINDNLEIFHEDIVKVYIIKYVSRWKSGYENLSNIRFRPLSIGEREVLVIEYNDEGNIRRLKFQLKYANNSDVNQFIRLFKY